MSIENLYDSIICRTSLHIPKGAIKDAGYCPVCTMVVEKKKGNALSPFNLHISSAVVYIHLHKHLYAIMCPLIVVLVLTFEIVNKSVIWVGTKIGKISYKHDVVFSRHSNNAKHIGNTDIYGFL